MQSICIAKEGKIRGEIDRIEIGVAVGQAIRWDPHRIEAQHIGIDGQIGPQLCGDTLGVECGDKDRARPGAGEVGHGLRHVAENGAADPRDLLDIHAGDLDMIHIEDRGECLGAAARIVNRYRRLVRQQIEQGPRRSSDPRMGQRLVEGVSAAGIVEGLDAQGHDDEPIPEPQSALGPILHSSRSPQAIGAISCSPVR